LLVAWCREEPWRVGQVLLVPPGAPGPVTWFGRGPSLAGDPIKVPLGQLRPGQWLPSPPLSVSAVSRQQLALQALDADRLLVRNTGRCSLLVEDSVVDSAEIVPGQLVQLGRQLLFICVQRSIDRPLEKQAAFDFPFGEADPHGIVGESPAIWALRRHIAHLATFPGHVLVTGSSGSGKELVAQALHALSPRAARPLVARNAATLPESLIDAELFGNAKNYPNPGMPERQGLIGAADGSTLFLDEVAELPHSAQAHLLRVLDAGEYQRLGESRPRRSDFRLVAATNREVSTLKHDLRARFSHQIAVPSLDGRKEDIPLLARHLLRDALEAGRPVDHPHPPGEDVPLDVMRRLLGHGYQTGVRELRSLLWNWLLAPGDASPAGAEREGQATSPPPAAPLEAPGRAGLPTPEQVQRCLDENNGVIEQSWRALGLSSRFALVRLIKRYDLEVRRRPARR
jgi:two-component system nitrogen regulation response regulator GlnG/two-component system response regulator HydG